MNNAPSTAPPSARRVQLRCEECDGGYTVPLSRLVYGNPRWCSWECRKARPRQFRHSPRLDRSCARCGAEFSVLPKKRARKYCSVKCAAAANQQAKSLRSRIQKTCQWCGVKFHRPRSHATARRKFCSKRCAALGRPIPGGRQSTIASRAIALWAATTQEHYECEKRVLNWSVDLVLPHRWLAIELDGVYWHSLPAMQARDARKDAALIAAGWTVRRVPIPGNATPESVAADLTLIIT